DLDVAQTTNGVKPEPRITSKSLCTPGCVTGVLMGCALKTITCNCSVGIGKK
ncbi:gallidermin/nisin family lantibiotic, partial [Enterococcus rotai]